MKIRSIETIPVQLPRRREHTWSGNITKIGGYLLIRIQTDEGLEGLGESPMLIEWGGDHQRYYGESRQTVAHVIRDYLAPAVAGEDPTNIELIHAKMDRVVKGHLYAKAGIDMACYDLMGKAANLPAHAFLGGAFRTRIKLAHSFGSNMSADEVEREAEAVVAEGVTTLKAKVGLDLRRDVEALARLRKVGGAGAEITIDANQAWPDAKTAIDAINRLDEHGLSFAEQPVEGMDRMAEVRRRVRPRVMADESAWTARDVYELARAEACDLVSIYYSKAGGLHPGRKVATACEIVGFRANLNGSAETGIGNAANLHLAASAKIIDLACVVMVNAPEGRAPTKIAAQLYRDDIVTEPYGYSDGCILVPEGPGLGVAIDEAKLAKYRID